ncbi:MAG TPA: hypothetical protein VH307_31300 [Streptosporangiaceae bacterium]|jgi:hypothetical protein|nr:hypothetical protein [Streptosporangiaceae bacterium]
MTFRNAVMGGRNLIRPWMQSPDFSVAAQTGWAIFENGDAFFFNLHATGSVTSNTVIIKGSGDGLFIYNGTPAHGTLLLAASAAAGTDAYGNRYSGPGIALSGPGGQNIIQARPDLGAILVYA